MPPKRKKSPAVPSGHCQPGEFTKLLQKVHSVEYVSHIHCQKGSQGRGPVSIYKDGERYSIRIPFFDGNSFSAMIIADTTARNELEAYYVETVIQEAIE